MFGFASSAFREPRLEIWTLLTVFLQRDEPPQKISKLAIAAETEADRYDTRTRVDCYECGVRDVDQTTGSLPMIIDGILKANTFARQAEVQAWEQEMTPCEHTLCLEQEAARKIDSQGAFGVRLKNIVY